MANRAFIRFTNVTIPKDATIRSAWVRMMAYDSQVASGVSLKCYFVDADNPSAPADKSTLDAFSLTAAVNWSGLPVWSDGIKYNTPDLKDILQTIVDRSGWASGNALVLIIEDDSSTSHRKMSAYDYLSASEKPALYVTWYSTVENYFDDTKWEPAQLDPETAIETAWSGTQWNFNVYAGAGGGKLKAKGTWMKNYRPGGMTVIHDHSGPVILEIHATDGILYYDSAYTSGTKVEPNWTNRNGDIEYLVLKVAVGDNDVFHVTNIVFDSTPAGAQTSTSTTSTASTTSSTASTTSTASTVSTSTSTSSTISTTSTASTTSSSSSSSSTMSTSSSTSTTASTMSTLSSTSSTASTVSTVSTASTISTTSSTSSTASTISTISTSSTISTTSSTVCSSSTTTTAPPSSTQLTVYIGTGADDGYARTDQGAYSNSANNVIIGDYLGYGYRSWLRFDNVTVPSGVTILSAFVRFTAYASGSTNTCNANVYCEAADDPTAPTTAADAMGRSLTTGTAWNAVGAWSNDSTYDTPDFASDLQEVIDRGGWNSGQAVNVMIQNNGSSFNANRQGSTYEFNSQTEIAELHITYI